MHFIVDFQELRFRSLSHSEHRLSFKGLIIKRILSTLFSNNLSALPLSLTLLFHLVMQFTHY